MWNPFKKQYRIVEEINSEGASRFWIERTILGIWTIFNNEYNQNEFSTYATANDRLSEIRAQKIKPTRKIHEPSQILSELSK